MATLLMMTLFADLLARFQRGVHRACALLGVEPRSFYNGVTGRALGLRRRRQRPAEKRRLRLRHRPRELLLRPARRPRAARAGGRTERQRHRRRQRRGGLRARLRRQLHSRMTRDAQAVNGEGDQPLRSAPGAAVPRSGLLFDLGAAAIDLAYEARELWFVFVRTALLLVPRQAREARAAHADVRDREQVALLSHDHDGLHRDDSLLPGRDSIAAGRPRLLDARRIRDVSRSSLVRDLLPLRSPR